MLSIDPKNTRVALIGASKYKKDISLNPLPGVEGNIRDLASLLTRPDIVGIPPDNIVPMLDWGDPKDVAERLSQLGREAQDTLIVYYTGHGKIGGSPPQLYLALSETTAADLQFNALSIDWVRNAISQSGAQKKILILDCCFSGRALGLMGGETDILEDRLDLKGTYTLASCPANSPAMAPPGEEHTAFTGEMLRVLKEGIDNDKEGISLEDIFSCIRKDCIRRSLPEPQQRNVQDGADFIIARNNRFDAKIKVQQDFEKLDEWRCQRKLSPEQFDKAVRVYRTDADRLDEKNRRIKEYTQDLLADKITIETYVFSMEMLFPPAKVSTTSAAIKGIIDEKTTPAEKIDAREAVKPTMHEESKVEDGVGRGKESAEWKARADAERVAKERRENEAKTKATAAKVERKLELRSTPLEDVTESDVMDMVSKYDFFHIKYNNSNKVLCHRYEVVKDKNGLKIAVIDHTTGLLWQSAGDMSLGFGDHSNQSFEYIEKINAQFAGYSDWRLPTLEEAMSLIRTKCLHPFGQKAYIDSVFSNVFDDDSHPILKFGYYIGFGILTSDKSKGVHPWYVDYTNGNCGVTKFNEGYIIHAIRTI